MIGAFILAGFVEVLIPKDLIMKWIGEGSGQKLHTHRLLDILPLTLTSQAAIHTPCGASPITRLLMDHNLRGRELFSDPSCDLVADPVGFLNRYVFVHHYMDVYKTDCPCLASPQVMKSSDREFQSTDFIPNPCFFLG